MNSYDSVSGYRPGYHDDYPDEYVDPNQLHPQVRRRAQRIVHRDRMTRLVKWWISLVGAMVAACIISGVVLAVMNVPMAASGAALVAVLLTIYLVSLALRPAWSN